VFSPLFYRRRVNGSYKADRFFYYSGGACLVVIANPSVWGWVVCWFARRLRGPPREAQHVGMQCGKQSQTDRSREITNYEEATFKRLSR